MAQGISSLVFRVATFVATQGGLGFTNAETSLSEAVRGPLMSKKNQEILCWGFQSISRRKLTTPFIQISTFVHDSGSSVICRGLCHYPAMLIFGGLVVGWLLAGDWWLGLGT